MYPVGLLFGLGFDTATEVALLVLAGTAVAGGLPFWAILSLPILFAAGMSLFDTIDGCFMNFAYDWAFAKPVRRSTTTSRSPGCRSSSPSSSGPSRCSASRHRAAPERTVLHFFAGFNINTAGFVIVGVFLVTWIVAAAWWRFGNVEAKWDSAMLPAGPEPRQRIQEAVEVA